METTPTTLLARPSVATVDEGAPSVVWRGLPRHSHHRHLQAKATDAYDMGGPLPICWCVL